tara:strand:+ start:303 stop:641 length:339 start_codon:yes stop_codon:yes gene_type:complete
MVKIEEYYFKNDLYIIKIGKNKEENWKIIQESEDNDFWFHLNDYPSCHVIISSNGNKKLDNLILKRGAVLCKQYSKYSNIKNLEIIYTKIKNIKLSDEIGSVITKNTKIIKI